MSAKIIKIAVASGKGGTGKTTIATNLALILSQNDTSVTYIDCDVEEPNGYIFLKPKIESTVSVGIPVPQVDEEKCDSCGTCAKICQYSAIICLAGKVMTFPEMCHGCGGCSAVCPSNAVREIEKEIGVLQKGQAGKVGFVHGKLNIGQAMSPPLIRAVKREVKGDCTYILDSPPGTSCPVIESIRDVDFTILVAEPTPFGLNDLKLAVDTVRELEQCFGVVINRAGVGNDEVEQYCQREGLDVLGLVPNDRKIAEAYSRGEIAINALPEYRRHIASIFNRIQKRTCT